jgi:hypothetical protein
MLIKEEVLDVRWLAVVHVYAYILRKIYDYIRIHARQA